MPGSFFDTNVLICIASGDAAKADRAEAIIARGGGAISVQVLNELTNVARRKMRLSWTDTRMFLSTFRSLLTVHPLTRETHETGLELAERYGLSVCDAMIAAPALQAGSDTLWSEDLQHGMTFDRGLRIPQSVSGCGLSFAGKIPSAHASKQPGWSISAMSPGPLGSQPSSAGVARSRRRPITPETSREMPTLPQLR
jgi:predicted nucleic acid-binding protein